MKVILGQWYGPLVASTSHFVGDPLVLVGRFWTWPLVAAYAMAFGGPLDDSTSIGSPDVATWPEVRYKKQNAQSFAVTHLISSFLFKKK